MPRTNYHPYPVSDSYSFLKLPICPNCQSVVDGGIQGINHCPNCGGFYHLEIRTQLLYKCIPVPGKETEDATRGS